MNRWFSKRSLITVLGVSAMVALAGCTPPEDEATPTPPPTPTPTAAPFVDNFRVTSLAVGNSTQGVDVDGDGAVDNGIEDTLTTINETIYVGIETALCPEGCDLQQQKILDAVEQVLNRVLSVETLSQALQNPIDNATINYITKFSQKIPKTDVDLEWWSASFSGVAFQLTKSLGKQPGKLDDKNEGLFGPGALTLSFSFTTQQGEELINVALVLQQGYTVVSSYNHELLTNMYTGGALSMDDLMNLVGEVVTKVFDVIPDTVEIPVTEDEILTLVSDALAPYADVVLDDGSDGFSIGLVANAEATAVK